MNLVLPELPSSAVVRYQRFGRASLHYSVIRVEPSDFRLREFTMGRINNILHFTLAVLEKHSLLTIGVEIMTVLDVRLKV